MSNEIFRLGIKDMDAIIEMESICFPNEPWQREDWIELLNDERAIYLAHLDESKIAANLFLYNWAGENDYLKVMTLSIHPDYRGQGRAQALLTAALEIAKKNNLDKILAETRLSNSAMQYILEKSGYREINRVDHYYDRPDETALKYCLDVPKS